MRNRCLRTKKAAPLLIQVVPSFFSSPLYFQHIESNVSIPQLHLFELPSERSDFMCNIKSHKNH